MAREFRPIPTVRAPDFPDNLDWIHTGGRKLRLADLRGKVVLLDFWRNNRWNRVVRLR